MGKRGLPVVAIVGRPNVGKSTLFNRLVGRSIAVVDDAPGVTRDRHHAIAEWTGRSFVLVDTGGLLLDSQGIIESRVREQVEAAIEESDLVLFTVDARSGPLPDDIEIAHLLRRLDVPTALVVTKVDSARHEAAAQEFSAVGLDPVYFVSGLDGRGAGDLMDAILARLPASEPPAETGAVRVAVIGKPNVGKSSIVNALLQRERMIVTDIPGTTRDAVDSEFRWEGRVFTLIDTAGLHRKQRMATGVEFFAAVRTMRSLDRADVALVVLDASAPLTRQDYRVAATPFELGVSCVYLFNKWDLAERATLTSRDIVREGARHVPSFEHAPSLFVSAKTSQRISRIPPTILSVYDGARVQIDADRLAECFENAVAARPIPYARGRAVRLRGIRQVGVAPPTFRVDVNQPEAVESSYRRFLVNRLRDRFGFLGSPIRLVLHREGRK
jgi:GTP-binding protein